MTSRIPCRKGAITCNLYKDGNYWPDYSEWIEQVWDLREVSIVTRGASHLSYHWQTAEVGYQLWTFLKRTYRKIWHDCCYYSNVRDSAYMRCEVLALQRGRRWCHTIYLERQKEFRNKNRQAFFDKNTPRSCLHKIMMHVPLSLTPSPPSWHARRTLGHLLATMAIRALTGSVVSSIATAKAGGGLAIQYFDAPQGNAELIHWRATRNTALPWFWLHDHKRSRRDRLVWNHSKSRIWNVSHRLACPWYKVCISSCSRTSCALEYLISPKVNDSLWKWLQKMPSA